MLLTVNTKYTGIILVLPARSCKLQVVKGCKCNLNTPVL